MNTPYECVYENLNEINKEINLYSVECIVVVEHLYNLVKDYFLKRNCAYYVYLYFGV